MSTPTLEVTPHRSTRAWVIGFALPALAVTVLFVAIPAVDALRLGFYEWGGLDNRRFVGFENFSELIGSYALREALLHNLIFAVGVTGGTVVIGGLVAAAIDRRVPAWQAFKVICFLPVIMPMTVTGIIWANALAPNGGFLNEMLGWISDDLPRAWLADPGTALYALVAVAVWQHAGFPMILLLAGMQAIPRELHEAATLDGVTAVQRMRYVILPMIRPVLATVVLLQFIFSFKVFDLVWVMTSGGPGTTTEVAGTFIYRSAFEYRDFGYASAAAVIVSVLITLISMVYLRIFKPSGLGEW